ncbi:MAG: hypothetical protein JWM79_3975, partial [Nocardioides sp.]|nr:hypothetical protein [Nocardioides sp.]
MGSVAEGAGWRLSTLGLNAKDGIIQAVRWRKGRKVSRKVVLEDGNTQLAAENGETIQVSTIVARLVDEPQVRQPLERFTGPFATTASKPTGSRMKRASRSRRCRPPKLQRSRLPRARRPPQHPGSFEPGKKWRLSSGSRAILTEMDDEQFWDRIAKSQESFSANDFEMIRPLAETEGFEPSVGVIPLRRFSKPLVSATHPRLRAR